MLLPLCLRIPRRFTMFRNKQIKANNEDMIEQMKANVSMSPPNREHAVSNEVGAFRLEVS